MKIVESIGSFKPFSIAVETQDELDALTTFFWLLEGQYAEIMEGMYDDLIKRGGKILNNDLVTNTLIFYGGAE